MGQRGSFQRTFKKYNELNENEHIRSSLVVEWLGLGDFTAGAGVPSLFGGWSHKPCDTAKEKEKEKGTCQFVECSYSSTERGICGTKYLH